MSPEGHRMRAESVPELKRVGGAPPHAAAVVVGEGDGVGGGAVGTGFGSVLDRFLFLPSILYYDSHFSSRKHTIL